MTEKYCGEWCAHDGRSQRSHLERIWSYIHR